MTDIEFTSTEVISGEASISSGVLTIRGAKVGCLAVEDSSGRLILAPQTQVGQDVEVDLSGFQIGSSVWKVHFPRGEAGSNTSGGISMRQALMLALLLE